MNRYLILLLFCGILGSTMAQKETSSDTLNRSDSTLVVKIDSNQFIPFAVSLDSFVWNPNPWSEIGCIIPLPPYEPPIWIFEPGIFTVTLASPYTESGAFNDIKNKKVKLLFPGGFAGTPNLDSKEALAFSKKYGVDLICQGCIRYPEDDEEGYNKLVFAYLDQLYGNAWRKELTHTPVGMKEINAQKRVELKVEKESKTTGKNELKKVPLKKATFNNWLFLIALPFIGVLYLISKRSRKSAP